MQAGRVDQTHRVAHLAAKPACRRPQHVLEQLRKHPRIAVAIGVGEGRTLRRLGARMVEPRLMARHHRFHVTKRRSAAKLGEQQHMELIARRKAADPSVGPEFADQPVEGRPWNEFEDVMENAIGVPHGIDPLSCPSESRNSGNE
jgi:hypothetical protein